MYSCYVTYNGGFPNSVCVDYSAYYELLLLGITVGACFAAGVCTF